MNSLASSKITVWYGYTATLCSYRDLNFLVPPLLSKKATSLLLDAFPLRQGFPAYNQSTVNSVIVKMLDNRRVKPLGDDVSKEQAEMFLFDVFNRSTVEEAKHKVLLRKGLV